MLRISDLRPWMFRFMNDTLFFSSDHNLRLVFNWTLLSPVTGKCCSSLPRLQDHGGRSVSGHVAGTSGQVISGEVEWLSQSQAGGGVRTTVKVSRLGRGSFAYLNWEVISTLLIGSRSGSIMIATKYHPSGCSSVATTLGETRAISSLNERSTAASLFTFVSTAWAWDNQIGTIINASHWRLGCCSLTYPRHGVDTAWTQHIDAQATVCLCMKQCLWNDCLYVTGFSPASCGWVEQWAFFYGVSWHSVGQHAPMITWKY